MAEQHLGQEQASEQGERGAQQRLDEIVNLINAADDGYEPPTLREIYLIAKGRV